MSKKNSKTNSQNEVKVNTNWETILGAGYGDKNVAYDFGQTASITPAYLISRADSIRSRIASTTVNLAEVGKLADEVEYLSSFGYLKSVIASRFSKWLKQDAAGFAYLLSLFTVIGSMVVFMVIR